MKRKQYGDAEIVGREKGICDLCKVKCGGKKGEKEAQQKRKESKQCVIETLQHQAATKEKGCQRE